MTKTPNRHAMPPAKAAKGAGCMPSAATAMTPAARRRMQPTSEALMNRLTARREGRPVEV